MPTQTILLIEDHRDSREVYGAMLRYSGYHVVEAKDGEEGVQLAHQHKPDVIVLDLQLPFMDGFQAAGVLKADPETAGIPVIAVSVHSQNVYQARAQAAGCDSFLGKPCPPTVLVNEVRRLIA